MDAPDVPVALPLIGRSDIERPLDEGRVSYFVSTIDLTRGDHPGMNPLAQAAVPGHRRGSPPTPPSTSGLPRDRTVIMGSRIKL